MTQGRVYTGVERYRLGRGMTPGDALAPSTFDWNNPVARITVVKVDADDEDDDD